MSDSGIRTKRHFDFGEKYGHKLDFLLPKDRCSIAATTCRFEIRGPGKKNKSNIYITRLQTFGISPSDYWQSGKTEKSKWATSRKINGANEILQCFGLTMEQVLEHFGSPEDNEVKTLDLVDIVEMMV